MPQRKKARIINHEPTMRDIDDARGVHWPTRAPMALFSCSQTTPACEHHRLVQRPPGPMHKSRDATSSE